jgi:hypothetical protein
VDLFDEVEPMWRRQLANKKPNDQMIKNLRRLNAGVSHAECESMNPDHYPHNMNAEAFRRE